MDQLLGLRDRAMGILDKAEASGDLRTALAAVGRAKELLELMGRMEGELEDEPTLGQLNYYDLREYDLSNLIGIPKLVKGAEPMPVVTVPSVD
jgi:hypothetical protein